MEKFRSFKDLSREGWGTEYPNEVLKQESNLHDKLQTGALERIADATEVMAKSYTDLIEENKSLKRSNETLRERKYELWRSNYALKGHITRLRNKVNSLNKLLNIKHK